MLHVIGDLVGVGLGIVIGLPEIVAEIGLIHGLPSASVLLLELIALVRIKASEGDWKEAYPALNGDVGYGALVAVGGNGDGIISYHTALGGGNGGACGNLNISNIMIII